MTDLDIRQTAEGAVIPVLVKPKGKRNGIDGIHDGALRVSVTAAPEKGRANAAVIAVLAKFLDAPKNRVRLETGEKSKRKSFLLIGFPAQEVRTKLREKGVI